MKTVALPAVRFLTLTVFFFICTIAWTQIGVGTTNPDTDAIMDIVSTNKGVLLPRLDLTSTSSASPLTAHVAGMLVYNLTATNDVFPGYYFNDGTRWVRSEDDSPVDSVTLGVDSFITSTYPTYASISGMGDLTFTARKPSVFVMLTASGFGFTFSLSGLYLRVRNITNSTTIGGTMTKIQSIEPFFGSSMTTWSCSFSKLLTGLTVGNTYTLRVEGAVVGVLGISAAVIQPVSTPNAEHLTLSVIH